MTATHREAGQLYRHTQVGVLPIILWIAVAGICVATAIESQATILWMLSALMVVVGLGMSTLTTTVTAERIEVVFGPGLYRRRIAMTEVASAELARSYALEGWGIRITGEGMLYNITGNQAVRIQLRSGKQLRIGTDDPAGLLAAITARLGAPDGERATA